MSDSVNDTSKDYDDMVDYKPSGPSDLTSFFGGDERENLQNEVNDPYKQWHAAGMPAFTTQNLEPWKQMYINFRCEEDLMAFAKLINQKLTPKTKVVWYPEKAKEENILNQWIEDE